MEPLLFLSHRTVGVHVSNVLSKLHVHTRAEAVSAAARLGLLNEGRTTHDAAADSLQHAYGHGDRR